MVKFVKRTIVLLISFIFITAFVPLKKVQAYDTNTPIMSSPTASLKEMQDWAVSHGATETFVSLAELYWNLAPLHGGINPAVAYAQSAKETYFGIFGNVLDESFHNPCGLKTAEGGSNDDPAAHQRFSSWTEGVMAHLDHLALYAGAPGYPKAPDDTYDPRHFSFLYNTAENSVEKLGGKWAPSLTYGTEIVIYINEINSFISDSFMPVCRMGGADRFETAVKISKAGWNRAANVLLAYGYNFPDALSSGTLGYKLNAPVLLSYSTSLPQVTINEIKRLGARNIYILGGTGVISSNIENYFNQNGYNVTRLSGIDRFATNIAINNKVMENNPADTAIVSNAYNFPDALAIGPYAASNKYPVLFTDADSLRSETSNFLIKYNIRKVIITGGTGVVSAAVENQLKNIGIAVTRIGGADRYETALKISAAFDSSFNRGVSIAQGGNYPDALSGVVLAAKRKLPLLLVEESYIKDNVLDYIKSR
ncbi:MAG: cell wall-binding repeat-containing protein, partial [Clostridiaceae bacterium]